MLGVTLPGFLAVPAELDLGTAVRLCLSSLLQDRFNFFTQMISDENKTQGQGQSLRTHRAVILCSFQAGQGPRE